MSDNDPRQITLPSGRVACTASLQRAVQAADGVTVNLNYTANLTAGSPLETLRPRHGVKMAPEPR